MKEKIEMNIDIDSNINPLGESSKLISNSILDIIREENLESYNLINNGYRLNIFKTSNSLSNIILLPGLPNLGIKNDNNIISFFNKIGSNLIFLNNENYLSLYEETLKLIEDIKKGEIEGINKDLPIFLVGLSFGGGVALKLADNSNITHTFGLSPLTNDTIGNIDWEGLLKYMKNNFSEIIEQGLELDIFKENILNQVNEKGKLSNNTTIFGLDNDPEIKIPENYNPIILKSDELGINHFGLRKTGKLDEDKKLIIFQKIINFNLSRNIEKLIIDLIIEKFGNNFYGLMTHGSRSIININNFNNNGDFDFIICLNKNNKGDSILLLEIIKTIKEKYNNINIDISFFYIDTIKKLGFNNIVTSTHGPVYSIVFKNTQILYGKNIFQESEEYFSKYDIHNAFNLEIGKYVDRLNRLYFTNNIDINILKKYVNRIIMCYMISRGDINIDETNNFTKEKSIKYLQNNISDFEYKENFIKLLSGENEININDIIDGLNDFLNKYGINKINLKKYSNKIRCISNITGYKTLLYIPDNFNNPEEVLGISCLGFKELNVLDNNIYLNIDQINKNLILGLTISKINTFLSNIYGYNIKNGIRIGDFGLKLLGDNKENAKLISSWQSYLEKELTKFISGDFKIGKLSSDFLNEGERKFSSLMIKNTLKIDDFLSLLKNSKYNLSDDFINSYLKKYFNSDYIPTISYKMLEIIYSSIEEHLELGYRISTKWKNKVFIFIGNQEKIILITEVMKSNINNSSMMIGLSPERK